MKGRETLAWEYRESWALKRKGDLEIPSEAGAAGMLQNQLLCSVPQAPSTSAVLFSLLYADSVCNFGRFLNISVPHFSWEWHTDSCLLGVRASGRVLWGRGWGFSFLLFQKQFCCFWVVIFLPPGIATLSCWLVPLPAEGVSLPVRAALEKSARSVETINLSSVAHGHSRPWSLVSGRSHCRTVTEKHARRL